MRQICGQVDDRVRSGCGVRHGERIRHVAARDAAHVTGNRFGDTVGSNQRNEGMTTLGEFADDRSS